MVGRHRHLGGGPVTRRLPHLPDDDDDGGRQKHDQHQVHAGDTGPPLQPRRRAGAVPALFANRPSGFRVGFRSLIIGEQVLDVRRLAGLVAIARTPTIRGLTAIGRRRIRSLAGLVAVVATRASTDAPIRGLGTIPARPLIRGLGLGVRRARVVVAGRQPGQLLVGPVPQVLRSGGEEGRELLPVHSAVLRPHRPHHSPSPLPSA